MRTWTDEYIYRNDLDEQAWVTVKEVGKMIDQAILWQKELNE